MATYISLFNLTDQGIRAFKESPKRAEVFKANAQKVGVSVKEVYWTMGAYDGVIIYEAPDDESAVSAMLALCSKGNLKSQTLRAFDAGEMDKIIAKAT